MQICSVLTFALSLVVPEVHRKMPGICVIGKNDSAMQNITDCRAKLPWLYRNWLYP